MADEERVNDMTPVLGEVEIPSNFESILPDYPFKVADFEGPLDLLIHLIKKNQVDIILWIKQYLKIMKNFITVCLIRIRINMFRQLL